MHKLPKLSERGAVHILALLLLIGGLAASVYLVGQQTNLFPKAYSPKPGRLLLSSTLCNTPTGACPTPSPTPAKRVFVTILTYDGNLGRLEGADAKCQAGANQARLGGTWKAWLSDSNTSAASRLNHNNGPYKLLDGTVIANNWNDLTDGTINHAINLSEYKSTVEAGNVWTNTTRSGEMNKDVNIQPAHCKNWTDSDWRTRGAIGSTWSGSTDYHWTESGYDYCSNQSKRLFCFEQ